MAGSPPPRASRPPTWAQVFKQWQTVCQEVNPRLLSHSPFLEIAVPAFANDAPFAEVVFDWWKTSELGARIEVIRRTGSWDPMWARPRPGEALTLQSLWEHRGRPEEMALVWVRAFCRDWYEHMPFFKGDWQQHHRILSEYLLHAVSDREQAIGMTRYSTGNIKYFLPDDLPDSRTRSEFCPMTWKDFVRIMAVCAHAAVSDWTPVALVPPRPRGAAR